MNKIKRFVAPVLAWLVFWLLSSAPTLFMLQDHPEYKTPIYLAIIAYGVLAAYAAEYFCDPEMPACRWVYDKYDVGYWTNCGHWALSKSQFETVCTFCGREIKEIHDD